MPGKSPFSDDWRECLRAHYRYVIRAEDHRTLETLTGVLHQVGFSEAELSRIYLEATMRAEDVPADFTPDMTVVAALISAAAGPPTQAASGDLIAAAEAAARVSENPVETDADAPPEAESTPADALPAADAPQDPDSPQQLSLF